MRVVDTFNKFLVGMHEDQVVIHVDSRVVVMGTADALNLAAWLVALADRHDPAVAAVIP